MENKNILIVNSEIYNFVKTILGAVNKEWDFDNSAKWEIHDCIREVLDALDEFDRIKAIKQLILLVLTRDLIYDYDLEGINTAHNGSVQIQWFKFDVDKDLRPDPKFWDCPGALYCELIKKIIRSEYIMKQISALIDAELYMYENANHLPHL